ncbi:glycosyltransferase family 2 protein [Leptolyngbya sp. AN02str]|uniref:glycosyltransferase family 2 protein n=1 Tax=Leptolyngbya sp. AN02str TaxID=3423363 RepID=UPI003D31FFA6
MPPTVSVVIPAYNAMAYLPETLASVLNQTWTDCEVLIINDGSTDGITEWATTVTDPRVRFMHQENGGVSRSRNLGIAQSQGTYIAFVDADDLWLSTKLEKQLQCFQHNPTLGLVYTWTQLIDELGTPTRTTICNHLEGQVWKDVLMSDPVGNGSAAMVHRRCLEQVGGFDPSLSIFEDRDLWIRIAEHYSFGVVKECLTHYRQHGNSAMRDRQKVLRDMRIVVDRSFATVPDEWLPIRNQVYGSLLNWQAWEAYSAGDFEMASHLKTQAVLHQPSLKFSKNWMRLSLKLWLNQQRGSANSAPEKVIASRFG